MSQADSTRLESLESRLRDVGITDAASAVEAGSSPSMMPEIPPSLASARGKTTEEILDDLNKSPLFMTELEMNDGVAALQALAYEGSPLENASDFKERGNECFKERKWADAKEFYTKGITILVTEVKRRLMDRFSGPSDAAVAGEGNGGKEAKEKVGTTTSTSTSNSNNTNTNTSTKANTDNDTSPSTKPITDNNSSTNTTTDSNNTSVSSSGEPSSDESQQEAEKEKAVLEQLHVNRAACHLELRNYRACTVDCAATLALNPRNIKAFYRSTKALVALGKIIEAEDACTKGLQVDEANVALQFLSAEIAEKKRRLTAEQIAKEEALARNKRRSLLIRAAMRARNIRLRFSARPPDIEDTQIQLVPDPDSPTSFLTFPTIVIYPAEEQSDFIKAFDERDSMHVHFTYLFPLPWDKDNAYTPATVECFIETARGRLLKMGKRVPLLKLLSLDGMEVMDGLVRIFVVPRAKTAKFVKEHRAMAGLPAS